MRAVSHLWRLLIATAVVGCTGGGGSGNSATNRDAGPTAAAADSDDGCHFTTTVSGGLEATFTGAGAACAYTSRGVSLTELGGNRVVLSMTFDDVDPNETGTFDARIDVSQQDDHWSGAKCSIDVTRNTLVQAKTKDDPFDQYLLVGTGSCSTPADYRSDAGAKGPVAIAPFTFAVRTLFY